MDGWPTAAWFSKGYLVHALSVSRRSKPSHEAGTRHSFCSYPVPRGSWHGTTECCVVEIVLIGGFCNKIRYIPFV
jgi:hypothetical protein